MSPGREESCHLDFVGRNVPRRYADRTAERLHTRPILVRALEPRAPFEHTRQECVVPLRSHRRFLGYWLGIVPPETSRRGVRTRAGSIPRVAQSALAIMSVDRTAMARRWSRSSRSTSLV